MLYIGIDPGLDGCVCGITTMEATQAVLHVEFHDTPTIEVAGKGSKAKREYLVQQMVHNLMTMTYKRAPGEVTAVLEKVHSMPEQGVASSFNFGMGFGIWIGILSALQIQYQLVAPQTWKKAIMPDMGKEKGGAIVRAQQLYPSAIEFLRLKKHHGRADALLMAEYAKRTAKLAASAAV